MSNNSKTIKAGVFHTGGYSRESIELNSLDDLLNLIKQKDEKIIVHRNSYKENSINRILFRMEKTSDIVSDETKEELSFLRNNDIIIEVYDDYRE
jgi:hypothetical protein